MTKQNIDRTNYGINLLKVFMAFEVILGHFCTWDDHTNLFFRCLKSVVSLAVPVFMMLSFYFLENILVNKNKDKQKTRLVKVITPQIGWTIIYWIIYVVLNTNEKITISHFFWQLFTGHSMLINPSMWFQIELIAITALFFFIFNHFEKDKGMKILAILLTVSFVLEYTEINRILFGELRYELKYSLGRFVEMIPFAVVGVYLKYFDVYKKLKNKYKIALPIIIVMFCIGFIVPYRTINDFGFSGLLKTYLAICILMFAMLLPLENLPIFLKNIINIISKYTLGIYCMHRLVNTIFEIVFKNPYKGMDSFVKCVILYVSCYIVSMLISLIPNKTIKNLVN